LTALAAGISACGFLLQLGLEGVVGFMLPPSMAVAIVLIPGLWIGRRLSRWVSRMVPSFETHAISGQTYHGRRGHVVIGQSRRGAAAQVRWQDLYGTTHSLMAEPLRDDDTIDAGTEVLIVKTRSREPRLVAIN
jgi:xanthosine utilization system XapX-like protein